MPSIAACKAGTAPSMTESPIAMTEPASIGEDGASGIATPETGTAASWAGATVASAALLLSTATAVVGEGAAGAGVTVADGVADVGDAAAAGRAALGVAEAWPGRTMVSMLVSAR